MKFRLVLVGWLVSGTWDNSTKFITERETKSEHVKTRALHVLGATGNQMAQKTALRWAAYKKINPHILKSSQECFKHINCSFHLLKRKTEGWLCTDIQRNDQLSLTRVKKKTSPPPNMNTQRELLYRNLSLQEHRLSLQAITTRGWDHHKIQLSSYFSQFFPH